MNQVTIRIWDGPTVRYVFSVDSTGSSSIGAVGGASNSSRADIEIDPWAGLIVDHRAGPTTPRSIREDDERYES